MMREDSPGEMTEPSMVHQKMSVVRVWLQLIRLPNLLTVPGDPIAGFVLAQLPYSNHPVKMALPCAISSLLLYAAGLISNDYFDLDEDRAERPNRPLPSGVISPGIAITVAILLAALGIAVAGYAGQTAMIIAAVLAIAIACYNVGLKRNLLIGPLNMGICRGLSLLMGAAVFERTGLLRVLVILAALGLTLYVAAVTRIALRETRSIEIGQNRWRPFISLATCLATMALYITSVLPAFVCTPAHGWIGAGVLTLAAAIWAWYGGKLLAGIPEPAVVGGTVGSLLRGLLLIQAAFCALGGDAGLAAACVLVLLWPVSALLGRWFYAS